MAGSVKSKLRCEPGIFYLPVFTTAWATREKTQANEEFFWAVEELRQRPDDKAWLVQLVVDIGSFQDREIGGGRQLSDIPNLPPACRAGHPFSAPHSGHRQTIPRFQPIRRPPRPDPASNPAPRRAPAGSGVAAIERLDRELSLCS